MSRSSLPHFDYGDYPDDQGFYGVYGGIYVAETLIPALEKLSEEFHKAISDSDFSKELYLEYRNYIGRPTPLYFARRFTEFLGGAKIFLKREDLNHTGAHKINNAIAQVLLAKRMGKKRIIAETGAGQHGVATAAAAAAHDLECVIYMGSQDIERQKANLFRMELMGAEVVSVDSGSCSLKDALNEALRDWVRNVENSFYVLGTAAGPYPYPAIAKSFLRVIGDECREQILELEGKLPKALVASVGGGSNAIGLFTAFLNDEEVDIFGVEAGGSGLDKGHAAPINQGDKGVLHGFYSYLMSDEDGQILETQSISAGLDYPGVGPEHAYLNDIGRVKYDYVLDSEAVECYRCLSRLEGIIPALESAHALAYSAKIARNYPKDRSLIVNLSGRGDKDMESVNKFQVN